MRYLDSLAKLVSLGALTVVGAACSASVERGNQPNPVANGTGGTVSDGTGGAGNSGNAPQTGGSGPQGAVAGPTVLRRLTNREYRASVRDLLGLGALPSENVDADLPAPKGFDNFADRLAVSTSLATQYATIANNKGVKEFVAPPCQAPMAEADCGAAFIRTFGERAFRRPLTAAEEQQYQGLFAAEVGRTGYSGGVTHVVEIMLQSPKFLYRFELGDASGGANRKLTPYEVASELSYMLLGSMPDQELFAAAAANALQTSAEVEQQARRLLKLPGARASLTAFLQEFSGIHRIADMQKTADVYPLFNADLKSAMTDETAQFIQAVVFDGDGSYNTLLTAPYSYVNAPLAQVYGMADPGQGNTLVKKDLNTTERIGLLGQASVLATFAKAYESGPILRGKMGRVRFLCETLPPPPKAVMPPPPDLNATTRERFAKHSTDAECAGCHSLIDPIGFGFENYDGLGAYRTEENGKPIDAAGNITGTPDMDGPFSGVPAFATKLAASQEAKQCLALKAYQWTFGRNDIAGERELANRIASDLTSGGLDIRELAVAITKSDNFFYRTFQ
ncbi:MAG: DUF1592 domain-containing protein [Polyangiaceae bacterium]|nr:DUF1592 domain-containing protein [Polyangiaceae bacterium]